MGLAPSTNIETNFQNGDIQIKIEKTIYNPGDQVSGKIYLQTRSNLPPSTLSFRFYGIEFFGIVKSGRNGLYYRTKRRKIINFRWWLHTWESQVPRGDYELPFCFTLPQGLPSSFHKETNLFIAHITYNMIIDLETNQKWEKTKLICKCQKLFIRKAVKATSISYTEQRKFPVRSLCCIPQGSVTYKATFNQNVFSLGQKAQLTLEIDNSHNKLTNKPINFQLVQLTTLEGKKYYETKAYHHIPRDIPAGASPITQVFSFYIPPQFQGYNHDLDTRDNKWPIGPGDFGRRELGQTTQGNLIQSVYYLEMVTDMDTLCSSSKRISCNIEMTFPDPFPEHFYLRDTWSPQVLPKIINNYFNRKVGINESKAREGGNLDNPEKELEMPLL